MNQELHVRRKGPYLLCSLVIALVVLGVTAVAGQTQNPPSNSSSRKMHNAAASSTKGPEVRPAATDPVVVSNDYIVGEDDLLHITVLKEPELTQNVVVRPDGKISLPLVNEIRVSGMTPSQIQLLLTDKLKAFVVAPQVTVTVADVRSKVVYITGEVNKPGAYPLVSPLNVLQLIASAGGLNVYANRKAILILRKKDGHQERYPFDYSKALRGHNPEQNISLQPGDTVVVP